MISFDQVLLLEEKVESAVRKIEQLTAENAALRRRCAELTNALEAKSEQFSSFQSDQSKIEEGILKALSRLNAVENVVLSAAAQSSSSNQTPVAPVQSEPVSAPVEQAVSSQPVQEPPVEQHSEKNPVGQPETVSPQADSIPQSESSDALAPDIDFEFGDTDASAPQQVSPSEPQIESEDSSEQSQPLFDIF